MIKKISLLAITILFVVIASSNSQQIKSNTDVLDEDDKLRLLFDEKLGIDSHILPTSFDDFDKSKLRIPIIDPRAAYFTGKYLFTLPVSTEQVINGDTYITTTACSNCHRLSKSGYSIERFPANFGALTINGKRVPIKDATQLDKPNITTPTFLGSGSNVKPNVLRDSSMGCGGINEDLPDSILHKHSPHKDCSQREVSGIEVQAVKGGFEVHNPIHSGLIAAIAQAPLVTALVKEATGSTYCTEEQVASLIAFFEETTVPYHAPLQGYLKGDNKALTPNRKNGLRVFLNKCSSCHSNAYFGSHEVYPKLFPSEYKGRGGFTGMEDDVNKVSVPQLYNIRDANFFTHQGKSFSKTIAAHAKVYGDSLKLNRQEYRDVSNFLKNGLYDQLLKEYTPFPEEGKQ